VALQRVWKQLQLGWNRRASEALQVQPRPFPRARSSAGFATLHAQAVPLRTKPTHGPCLARLRAPAARRAERLLLALALMLSLAIYLSITNRSATHTLFLRPYLAHFCPVFSRFFAVFSVLKPGFQKVAPKDRGAVP